MHYEEHFTDLHAALQDVHGCFRRQAAALPETRDPAGALCRLRLAVHEWMTNLTRHAAFDDRRPEVRVQIRRRGALHLCTVEDNSRGFDLAAQLDRRPDLARYARTLPAGGMGLLLLRASTERLEYERLEKHRHRLRLAVYPRLRETTNGTREDPPGR